MADQSDLCKVLFLDVGHGSSTVICFPGKGEGVVIDSPDAPTTIRALRQEGINRLRLVLVTHSDHDHVAGVASIVRSFQGQIDWVLYHPDRRRVVDSQEAFWQLVGAVKERRIRSGPADSDHGDFIEMSAGRCAILYPKYEDVVRNLKAGGTPNRASAAFFFEIENHAFLLCGDLEGDGWSHLRDASGLPKVSVFLFPHHGGEFQLKSYVPDARAGRGRAKRQPCVTQGELLEVMAPETVVISSGTAENKKYPPKAKVLRMIKDFGGSRAGFRLMCTRLTRRCDPNPAAHRSSALQHLSAVNVPRISVPRNTDCPCAGTVVIRIDRSRNLTIAPSSKVHREIIGALAHPACVT